MKTPYTISYAQNREDIILEGFFKPGQKGFYVDVGAGSPFIDSVTRRFYDAGWRGINIEPIDHIYNSLTEHRTRDINLNLGVSNKKGSLNFREYAADGFSTLAQNIQEEYEKKPSKLTQKHRDYTIEVRSLADIFKEHKVKSIQFLKVDVEGYEYEVIEGNDWAKYRPEVICIEANHVAKNWRTILLKNEYKLAHFDGLNEYYIDTKVRAVEDFSYVKAVIDREPVIRYDAAKTIIQLDEDIAVREKHQEFLEEHIKHYEYALSQERAKLARLHDPREYARLVATKARHRLHRGKDSKDQE